MKKTNISRTQFYNISQLRINYWNRLKVDSHALNVNNLSNSKQEEIKNRVKQLIDELTNIESYFAIPGTVRLKSISNLFHSEEYSSLAYKINETCKQLVGNKFFTVVFRKKDGTLRKMNCRLGVTKHLKGGTKGYDKSNLVTVYDIVKKGYRTVNLDTLEEIKARGLKVTV